MQWVASHRGIRKMTIFNFNKRLTISLIAYQPVHLNPHSKSTCDIWQTSKLKRDSGERMRQCLVASDSAESPLILPVISHYLRLILTRCRYQGGYLVSRFKEVERIIQYSGPFAEITVDRLARKFPRHFISYILSSPALKASGLLL